MSFYPDFSGTNNFKVDYFTSQKVEEVVAGILLLAKVFASETAKDIWLASSYVVPTNQRIERVWFKLGTTAFEAIRLLAEVVLYDFYLDYEGNPIFRPRGEEGNEVDNLKEPDMEGYEIDQSNQELHPHVIVIGEGYE